jgi:EAL domain-containing protein (putative c-di-GMP-specific phosphodiesterase class I)
LDDDDKFLDDMNAALSGWSDPVGHLRRALDNDELTLYCQPIRALIGTPGYPIAEILVRMRQEENALLPPGDFLPVFEHYGMMPQLDRWVVRQVAQRLARGSKVRRLSINVSSQTLDDAEFPAFFGAQLKSAGLAAGAILFEIDETDALERAESAGRFAAAIKAAGAGLMVDGFGRRAVSFSALKTLRVDFIKVDGAITRKLLTSEPMSNKMKAVVRVAEAMGAGVIAEFVEDPDVLVRLKALDVGYAQGFGVHQPQPMDSVLG